MSGVDQKLVIHVATEAVVMLGITIFFYNKTRALNNEIKDIKSTIEMFGNILKGHDVALHQILGGTEEASRNKGILKESAERRKSTKKPEYTDQDIQKDMQEELKDLEEEFIEEKPKSKPKKEKKSPKAEAEAEEKKEEVKSSPPKAEVEVDKKEEEEKKPEKEESDNEIY